MAIGVKITDVEDAFLGGAFDVEIRNGQFWLVWVGLSVTVAAMSLIFPSEAPELLISGLVMALGCSIFWFQERRNWWRKTIGVDQGQVTVEGGSGGWSVDIEPGMEVTVEERRREFRNSEGKRRVKMLQDVYYGERVVVRGVESRKGAEEIAARLAEAVERYKAAT